MQKIKGLLFPQERGPMQHPIAAMFSKEILEVNKLKDCKTPRVNNIFNMAMKLASGDHQYHKLYLYVVPFSQKYGK